MRILLLSYAFAPQIGGIETVSRILAEQFSRLGSSVTVVTHTPGEDFDGEYKVLRRPPQRRLRKLVRDSDVILQSNISLRTLLPVFFTSRPIVIIHHSLITRLDGSRGWLDYLKRALLFRCFNISVSQMIARDLPVKSLIIGNPFEASEFSNARDIARDQDIVFLGRLISEKGCDVALRALVFLKRDGLTPSFTVIGDGPEMPALKRLTEQLDLSAQVRFLGTVRQGRGNLVARHKIMVVPSTWEEPFGVVALEGIAAGCCVVVARSGGLPEAVGPCGILFPKGDAAALASVLNELLTNTESRDRLIACRNQHLAQFQPEVVAKRYLDFFESALRN